MLFDRNKKKRKREKQCDDKKKKKGRRGSRRDGKKEDNEAESGEESRERFEMNATEDVNVDEPVEVSRDQVERIDENDHQSHSDD